MQDKKDNLQAISGKELEAMLASIRSKRLPPIRNYKAGPWAGALGGAPMQPAQAAAEGIDFGIKMPALIGEPQRPLTSDECKEMFGIPTAVKINFIPQMLTSLMMEQATLLVNYCRENRVSATKKHTRLIKAAVDEYGERLREAYGPAAFRAYLAYARRFQEETATNVWMMELHADALCRNQAPGEKHHPIFIRALVIVMLIRFCQKYDEEMDRLIASKIGQPVRQKADVYQQCILAMCISLAEDLGYRINPDKIMGDWVRILSNKAHSLADKILSEEGY